MEQLLSEILKSAGSTASVPSTSVRAVAYARVSTDEQEERGLSLPAQTREIEDYACRHDMVIVETFSEAASGYQDEHKRVEFWRMMELAKQDNSISVVLVHEFSRFCRGPWMTPQLVGELQAHGVRVVSVTEPSFDVDSIQGMWIQKITEAKNASLSMEIAMHVRKGMRENIRRRDPEIGHCYKNGGQARFGYETYKVQRGTDKKGLPILKSLWRLDERITGGKPIHQWAHDCLMMAKDGASLDKIRDFCNDNGVPAPRSQYWSSTTWYSLLLPHSLLQCAGYGVWNVRAKKRRYNPPAEWEIVEDAHPGIISLEEVDEIIKVRQRRPKMLPKESGGMARTKGSRYMLSGGLFVCGRCGSNMVGFTGTNGKGRRRDYYVCGTAQYRRSLGCGKGVHIDKETIEEAVWEGVEQRFKDWADMEAFARTVNEKVKELHQQFASARIEAERRLAGIEKKIRNLRKALEDGLEDVKWANSRLLELSREQEIWEAKAEEVGRQTAPPELDMDTVRRYYDDFRRVIGEGTNEERRMFVRCFVQEIRLEPTSREVTVTFKGMPAQFVKGMGAHTGLN